MPWVNTATVKNSKKQTNERGGKIHQDFHKGISQFSHSVVCDSLWPHGLQHTRPPCPSPTPRVPSNSCPSSRWCHATIWSSVIPFSSCLQSFPASGSFQMCQLFASGDWCIGVSASTSVLPMKDWFPLEWTGWISLQSKTLRSLLHYHSSKASILRPSAFFIVQLSHPYMTTGKTIALTRQTFAGKVMSLPFNMLHKLVITFLPRNRNRQKIPKDTRLDIWIYYGVITNRRKLRKEWKYP